MSRSRTSSIFYAAAFTILICQFAVAESSPESRCREFHDQEAQGAQPVVKTMPTSKTAIAKITYNVAWTGIHALSNSIRFCKAQMSKCATYYKSSGANAIPTCQKRLKYLVDEYEENLRLTRQKQSEAAFSLAAEGVSLNADGSIAGDMTEKEIWNNKNHPSKLNPSPGLQRDPAESEQEESAYDAGWKSTPTSDNIEDLRDQSQLGY